LNDAYHGGCRGQASKKAFSGNDNMRTGRCSAKLPAMLVAIVVVFICPAAAQIQVTSASPDAAPQGTLNLNVTISGSGFKKGATAQWFITGTNNTGGVTVNSTSFNGSNKLTANISVASDATISGFDVIVKNTDGRTGKGTDTFVVTEKGTPIGCSTTGTPNGFSLAAVLNPVQLNGTALITTLRLGNAIRVRSLDLNRDGIVDSLAAFVASGAGSGSIPGTYIFFLDPSTGTVQATNPVTGAAWQNPLQVLSGVRATQAAAGDVNGDGVPDFVMGGIDNTAYLFVGRVSGGAYSPTYTAYQVTPPPGAPSGWSISVAMGDLDGDGADEIAIGALPGKRESNIPAVFIFKYAGAVNFFEQIQDPTSNQGSNFAGSIAIGNIDGTYGNELAVGAKAANTTGLVYVFPYPASQANYFTVSGAGPNFGEALGIADVNVDGSPDLVVITGAQFNKSDSSAQALVFSGPVHPAAGYSNQLLPATGLSYSWGAPNSDVGEMISAGVVAVGAPNATEGNGCGGIQGGVGAVHLFTSPFNSSQQPNYVFEPPTLAGSTAFEFGYGVGVVPGFPFILVGAHFQQVGVTSNAGQVYVYKSSN
jgi:hypothetical protein